jgi:hypothetical protein
MTLYWEYAVLHDMMMMNEELERNWKNADIA